MPRKVVESSEWKTERISFFQLEAIQGQPWVIQGLDVGGRVEFEIRLGSKDEYAANVVKLSPPQEKTFQLVKTLLS